MTEFTEPGRIGNAFGPGRSAVICLTCGAVVLVPRAEEPDWLELHRTRHEPLGEPPC